MRARCACVCACACARARGLMAALPGGGGPAEDGSELRSHACVVAKVETRGRVPGVGRIVGGRGALPAAADDTRADLAQTYYTTRESTVSKIHSLANGRKARGATGSRCSKVANTSISIARGPVTMLKHTFHLYYPLSRLKASSVYTSLLQSLAPTLPPLVVGPAPPRGRASLAASPPIPSAAAEVPRWRGCHPSQD